MSDKLIFGIYPGSGVGADPGGGVIDGPADDPSQMQQALDQLQGNASQFVVRGYVQYMGNGQSSNLTPTDVEQYAMNRRKLDMALCFRDPAGDVAGWSNYVRAVLRQYGLHLTSLQVTEEPNNPDATAGGDGSTPNVHEAIIAGVLAAKDEALRHGYAVQIGFNATPAFSPADPFWTRIGQLATPEFLAALDYIALDFFPDVFRPLPLGLDLRAAVNSVIGGFRQMSSTLGHIPLSVPMHIGETGWPTDATRTEQRQAEVLETVVRTIYARRAELNITHYEHFDLRDADSSNASTFAHFGIMRDDYSPKPAFDVYRKLIAELG